MIPTIWYQLDFPCTRQAQEALSRVEHVENLDLSNWAGIR
jgi:hypothetical protein